MTPPLIICMGVSGSGKSTCASILAARFNLPFIEADDLHSLANKEKMQSGKPLTDADREPWMQAVSEQISFYAQRGTGCVLAHSALRRAHRDQLRSIGLRALFLHLDAPRETIAQRLSKRKNHFMPVGLLESQFDSFQETKNESDIVSLNAILDREDLIAQAVSIVDNFIEGETSNALSNAR